jgi:hypothetical protein
MHSSVGGIDLLHRGQIAMCFPHGEHGGNSQDLLGVYSHFVWLPAGSDLLMSFKVFKIGEVCPPHEGR